MSGRAVVPSIACVQVGDTVSLRVVTRAGPTDVVGTLLAASARSLTVRRRDGQVSEITRESIQAGRVVPPGPSRMVDAGELQRIAAAGWRPLESEPLGDWTLRAAGGFTGRANSALPVGDPGRPLDAAVEAVVRWYGDRGLPARIQLPTAGAPQALPGLLDAAGWTAEPSVHVMTAELTPVVRAFRSEVEVRLDEEPDDDWLVTFRDGPVPDVARAVLVNHDDVVFASIRDGSRCVATARAAVDGRWVGLSCVAVAPDRRRAGLGRAVSAAALRWALARGARRVYLQVTADNAPAVALWEQMGLAVHHDYAYRSAPAG